VLAQAADFSDAAPRVLDAFCIALEIEVAELWLPDDENRLLVCAACRVSEALGDATAFKAVCARITFSLGAGMVGGVWQSRTPMWVDDIARYPNFRRRSAATRLGLHTGFAFPILVGAECRGVMSFFSRRALPPEPPLLEMMAGIGRDIGQFIQRTRAEALLKVRIRQQAVVAELGQAALANQQLPDLMDRAVTLVAEALDVDLCKVLELLPDERHLLLRAGTGLRPDKVGRATVSAGAGSQAGYTLSADEPVIVRELSSETRFEAPNLLQEHGAVSGISVRIGGAGEHAPYGILGAHARQRREFTTDDTLFLQSVANVLASAIERKRAEMALADSERRLRRVLDNLFAFVGVLTPDGIVIETNRAPLEAAAIKLADVQGRRFEDCYWWSYSVEVQAQLREAITRAGQGEMVRYDTDARVAGGRLMAIDFMLAPLRDEAGVIVGLIPSAVDISERKRLTEERFQAFLDVAPDALILVRSDGTIHSVNEQAERLFGYARGELIGRPHELLMPDRYREPHTEHQRRYFENPRRRPMGSDLEIYGRTRDGREIPLEVSLSPMEMPEGTIALAAVRDNTERKQAEQTLRAAKKTAEIANALKSRFVAAASHDLRQPLQTIGLLGGVLAQTAKDDASQAPLKQLGDTVTAMGDIIDSLLDIDRLDTGQIKPEIVAFPIQRLFDRMRDQYGYLAGTRGLQLRTVGSSAIARSDPRLLERLVGNLVSNAIKYTETGGRVLIGCRRRGGNLRIEVRDTGVGIPEGQLESIFEEYYRLAPSSDRPREPGLGLGLALVKRLAEVLEHQVEVSSVLYKGSAFALELPLANAACDPSHDEAAPATKPGVPVLLVEDETGPRESLRLLLELNGYAVCAVATVSEALDFEVHPFSPRLVIADYQLGGSMTGLQLIQHLSDTTGWQFPAIVLTGDSSPSTRREIESAGCLHVAKPARPDDLLALADQMTGRGLDASDGATAQEAPGFSAHIPGPDPATPDAATVFVVEDDTQIQAAVRGLLEAAGHRVEAFASAEQFLRTLGAKARRGCVVLDVGLPGMSGLQVQERLKADGFHLPVVVITGRHEVSLAVRAMRAGAVDFLEKPFDADRLLQAVDRALTPAAPSSAVAPQPEFGDMAARFAGLTPREREVIGLVAEGHPNKEVAYRLGLSQRTVENYRARGMQKLGIRSLAELVRLAVAAEAGGFPILPQ